MEIVRLEEEEEDILSFLKLFRCCCQQQVPAPELAIYSSFVQLPQEKLYCTPLLRGFSVSSPESLPLASKFQ